MKKSLILLPIAAMLISGCSLLPSKKGKSSSSSNTQQSGGGSQGTGVVPVTPGGGGGGGGVTPEEGASHTLPWELKASDLYDSSKKSYADYEGVYNFDGTKVTFQNAVMVNADPASTDSKQLHVIQLRKDDTANSKPKGILTVSKVRPTTVVITALLGTNPNTGAKYTWSSSQIGTVKFNGTAVTVPSSSTATDAGYATDWMLHTVTLNVNATTDGDFVIDNTSGHVVYITSINFKA